MPKFLITLDHDEIVQAITDWAQKNHGVTAGRVNVSAKMEWRGYGPSERQEPVVSITVES